MVIQAAASATVSDRFANLFPTPFLHRHLGGMDSVNHQLAALMAAIEASEPNASMGTTTEGGFQTQMDIFRRDNPALAILKECIIAAVRQYAEVLVRQECVQEPPRVEFHVWGWGVSLKSGHWQGLHVHPDAHISGVYYVRVPPAIQQQNHDEGKISFYDPRPRANMNQLPLQGIRRRETPAEGDLLVFPSWLEHSVSPFHGLGERICIAFNAKLAFGQ
jgi:uncharacterized protein (TIGR02466 family)